MVRFSRVCLFILCLFLLISCSERSFTLSSSSLTRNVYIDTEKRKESVVLSILLEAKTDESFTFSLISPSGDLTWRGTLENEDDYYCATLLLGDNAIFEEGEYTLIVSSSSTSSLSQSLEISKREDIISYSSHSYSYIKEEFFDRDGEVTDIKENADYVIFSYLDRYSNNITIREEFNI